MRILITASRDWTDRETMRAALTDAVSAHTGRVVVVEGGAHGGDKLAASVAIGEGWSVEEYPVNSWYQDGVFNRLAGLERNQLMVDTRPDVCIAFAMPCSKPPHKTMAPHTSHGVSDCIARAKRAGIPVKVVTCRN